MRKHFGIGLSLLVFSVTIGLTQPARGQDDRPNPQGRFAAPPPFDLLPPGARALGLGGAFIGVADDATASEANPAGLAILSKPEVSLHLGASTPDVEIDDVDAKGTVDFVNGFRDLFGLDRVSAETRTSIDERNIGFTYASYVHPFDRWTFSIYIQKGIRFEGSTRFFLVDDFFVDFYSTATDFDFEQENLGLSAAFKVSDKLALGFSVRASELDVAQSNLFRIELFNDFELFFYLPPFTDVIQFSTVVDDSDEDITWNAGALFNPNGKLSVGLVYKEGGDFEIRGTVDAFECINIPNVVFFPDITFTCDPVARTGTSFFPLQVDEPRPRYRFELPDFIGIGLAWRPTDQWLVALDVDHITYSNLSQAPDVIAGSGGVLEEIDDEYEIHFGVEYTKLLGDDNVPLSFRFGVFTDEDHDGFARVDSDDTHVTVGFGTVFDGNLQIDLAGHFSDRISEGLLSAVYRF
ncbi:MAG: outer membrane protein transport protein [Holophagales bacterium]|nr:outer membrane protein transport protein [Holophagales bacterium]